MQISQCTLFINVIMYVVSTYSKASNLIIHQTPRPLLAITKSSVYIKVAIYKMGFFINFVNAEIKLE